MNEKEKQLAYLQEIGFRINQMESEGITEIALEDYKELHNALIEFFISYKDVSEKIEEIFDVTTINEHLDRKKNEFVEKVKEDNLSLGEFPKDYEDLLICGFIQGANDFNDLIGYLTLKV